MAEKYLHKNAFNEVYIDQIKHTKLRTIEQDFLLCHANLLDNFNTSLIQTTKNVHFKTDFYEKGLILKHDIDYFEIEKILNIDQSSYFVCLEIKPSVPEELILIKHSDLVYKKTHDKKRLGDQVFILCDSLNIK